MTEFMDNEKIGRKISFDKEWGLWHRGPGDIVIIREQPRTRGSFAKIALTANPFLLDLGGHIGSFVRYMRDKGYTGKTVSVEPDPNNVRVFKKNCPNETLIEAAITGINKRKGKLYLGPKCPAANTLVEYGRKKNTVDVKLVSWKSLMRKHPWGSIKSDIQGAEYSFDWSLVPATVQVLCLEYHFYKSEWVDEMWKIHNILLGLGFEVQRKPVVNLRMGFTEAVYKRIPNANT